MRLGSQRSLESVYKFNGVLTYPGVVMGSDVQEKKKTRGAIEKKR